MNDWSLQKQLRIKAGMINNCEKIAWGSETALMERAADEIDRLKADLSSSYYELNKALTQVAVLKNEIIAILEGEKAVSDE